MQGYLTKPNKSIGSKKRFFVLDRCTLTYYENETKAEKLADIFLNSQTRVSAAGALQLNIDNVSVGNKTSGKTSYVLMCDIGPEQRDQWVAALKSACGIEEAERLKALQDQARIDAERREAEERSRQAQEAERLKALQDQARIDAERREAEERARQEAERIKFHDQEQQPSILAPDPEVFDIPDSNFDLKPREETAVTSNAVHKACDAHFC